MKLVINADDFGYTRGITEGIIEGVKKGIIRSTTVMINMPYVEYGKQLAKDCPELGIGLHFNLTVGKSLTKNKTLTDENGVFLNKKIIHSKELDMEEVYLEWKAQIEKYIEVFGHLPTHIDSHHSVHDFNEKFYEVSSKLAKEYGLSMRRHGPYKYVVGYFSTTATPETLIKLIEENKDEDIEIMAHPGYCDLELYLDSSYNVHRVMELAGLCDPKIVNYVKEHSIELAHY